MKISYKKLWVLLAEKEISKQRFREMLEISTGTMTKLNKGEEVSMNTLLRICILIVISEIFVMQSKWIMRKNKPVNARSSYR